jgi:hypothetical protein
MIIPIYQNDLFLGLEVMSGDNFEVGAITPRAPSTGAYHHESAGKAGGRNNHNKAGIAEF